MNWLSRASASPGGRTAAPPPAETTPQTRPSTTTGCSNAGVDPGLHARPRRSSQTHRRSHRFEPDARCVGRARSGWGHPAAQFVPGWNGCSPVAPMTVAVPIRLIAAHLHQGQDPRACATSRATAANTSSGVAPRATSVATRPQRRLFVGQPAKILPRLGRGDRRRHQLGEPSQTVLGARRSSGPGSTEPVATRPQTFPSTMIGALTTATDEAGALRLRRSRRPVSAKSPISRRPTGP